MGREPEYASYRRNQFTGFHDAWNRTYSTTWGRFTSADPYVMSGGLGNPQGWNRYAYVQEDPVNFHDPEGLFALCPLFTHSTGYACVVDDVIGMEYEPTRIYEGGVEPLKGGGGGGGETDGLVDPWGAALLSYIWSLPGDCASQLSAHNLSQEGLGANAAQLNFYDLSQTKHESIQLYTLSRLFDANNPANQVTLGSFFASKQGTFDGDLEALIVSVAQVPSAGILFTPNVLLARTFGSLSFAEQNGLLLHELLHYQTGADDADLLGMLGISNPEGINASVRLTEWLVNGCK